MNNLSPETRGKIRRYLNNSDLIYAVSDESEEEVKKFLDWLDTLLTPSVEGNTDTADRDLLTLHEAKLIESFADGFVATDQDDGQYWGDRLLPLYKRAFDKGKQFRVDFAQTLRPGGGWEIKELEWNYNAKGADSSNHDWYAITPVDVYHIHKTAVDKFRLWTEIVRKKSLSIFDSLESAKLHAQQDYVARIKTGLREG